MSGCFYIGFVVYLESVIWYMLSISLCEHHLILFADLLHWICWAYGALGTTMRTSLTCWLHWDELLTIHTSSFMVVDKPEAQRFMVLVVILAPTQNVERWEYKATHRLPAGKSLLAENAGSVCGLCQDCFAAVSGAPVNYCNRLNQDYECQMGWSTKRTIH